MTISHGDHLDNTIEALQGDLTSMGGNGPKAIDGWISAIENNGTESLQPIAKLLGDLKGELDGRPNGAKIGKLLSQLGEQTTAAAQDAREDLAPKLKRLGELLSKAGKSLS